MIGDVYFTEEEAAVVRETAQTFALWYADRYSFEEYESRMQSYLAGYIDGETLKEHGYELYFDIIEWLKIQPEE